MEETFNILIAGDFCPIGRNETPFSSGDFSNLKEFQTIRDRADFFVVNLESPLTNSNFKIKKTGPNIKAAPKTIAALKFLNVNLVTAANNHILDSGEEGVLHTIALCRNNNIEVVGAAKNLDEARRYFSTEIKGKRVAFLNFAENEFCAATANSAGANPINEVSNFRDIQIAKEDNDLVIVIVHGGREHYQLPTPKQRERFRFYADAGADFVVGHHTHCYSGYEIYKGKPIFYSLGNFIFDYKKKYQKGKWTEGFAVMFKIDSQISFELIPFKQGQEENPALVLMKDEDEQNFLQRISELNTIIGDNELFSEEWEKYIKLQELNYNTMLTIQNKYLRAAVNKRLLPYLSLHDNEHLLLLLNIIRCETHREITTKILSKKLEK